MSDAASLGTRLGGFGVGVEGGFAGEIAGPLGYWVHGGWQRFVDRYSEAGLDWPVGGATTESFVTVSGGLSLSF